MRLAAKWCQLFQSSIITGPDEEIRGDVRSFDCLTNPRYVNDNSTSSSSTSSNTIDNFKLRFSNVYPSIIHPLITATETLFRIQLAEKHPDVFSDAAQQNKKYYLNAMKLLWSEPGEGKQELHYDVPNRRLAAERYSCILYCTPCYHTAVPSAPASQLAPAFTKGKCTDKEIEKNAAIFYSVRFISNLVPAGSGMIFNTSVAHYGVENVMRTQKRIVIFALFCPRIDRNPDSVQRFPLGLATNQA